MTNTEQPTPEATSLADELWWILGSRGGDARQGAIRDAADRIDRFAAQQRAEAVEQAERVGRGLELNAIACFLEGWTASGPPGWKNAARTLAHHVRNGAHRDARAPTPPPGDAGERAREIDDIRDWHRQARERNESMSLGFDSVDALLAEIDVLQSERTAAASQARREAIEECAQLCDLDANDTGEFPSGAAFAFEARQLARRIRALATPQESAS